MDEASWNGTSGEVIDSSGNGNHGVGVGATPPTTGAGKFGNGGVFDGEDDYVSIPHTSGNSLDITKDKITLSAWIKPKTVSGDHKIFYKSEDNSKGYGLAIYHNKLESYVYTSSGVISTRSVSGKTDLNINEWYFVTCVYDGKKAQLYLNGNPYGEAQYGSGNILSANHSLHIGKYDVAEMLYFDGVIDEVRIYNRALSPAEVRDLYNWAPGPVTYYNFDEGSGTILHD
ncbi:MAG: LamG domain-containing protein, partial [Candidatus Helarchaeota archaeon]